MQGSVFPNFILMKHSEQSGRGHWIEAEAGYLPVAVPLRGALVMCTSMTVTRSCQPRCLASVPAWQLLQQHIPAWTPHAPHITVKEAKSLLTKASEI